MNRAIFMTMVLAVGSLTACGGATPEPASQATPVSRSVPRLPLDSLAFKGGICGVSTLYFKFDSALLSRASQAKLKEAATCLREEVGPGIKLIGNADPRGTEEYNLALGERRAQSVWNYLLDLGVSPERLTFMSYGEELAEGMNDATFALDRNVRAQRRETGAMLATPIASLR